MGCGGWVVAGGPDQVNGIFKSLRAFMADVKTTMSTIYTASQPAWQQGGQLPANRSVAIQQI
jgi:hypothetical protein